MLKFVLKFEWTVIKAVFRAVVTTCKQRRSLRPIGELLFVWQPFKELGKGRFKKGNYYSFIKDEYLTQITKGLRELK